MTTERIDHSSQAVATWTADQALAFFVQEMRDYREDIRSKAKETRAAVAELIEALRKSEATLSGSLKARGYQPGSSVDGWEPAVAAEVRTLSEVRAALAKAGA